MASMASLPPLPSTGPAPSGNPPEQSPPLASMPEEPPQGNQAMGTAQNIMRQIMDMRRTNEALAAQYPPASKALRMANESLKEAMLQIVREVQQAPGSN